MSVLQFEAPKGYLWERRMTKDGAFVYRCQNGEFFRYFIHDPQNETGWGGWTFMVQMTTGEQVVIKGPWASRPEVINQYFPDREPVPADQEPGNFQDSIMQQIYFPSAIPF